MHGGTWAPSRPRRCDFGAWFHVDGAYDGFAAAVPADLRALRLADSVAVDTLPGWATIVAVPLATRPRAVIFDLDGTIVDNMALHAEAFAAFADRHGLPALTPADRARLDGRRNSEIFPVLFGRELPREEWLAYEDEKEGLYRQLSRGRLTVVAGLPLLLDRLGEARIAVALATSAPAANVAHTLGEIGLVAAFPTIVRGDQVAQGKPAPDVFLEVSRQLDVATGDCLVFEDAPMGITAARAAGMRVVALTTSFSAEQFDRHPDRPDLACPDYADFLARAAW